jgi:TRAP-type C4-dicarboxylate transport system permease small subunit
MSKVEEYSLAVALAILIFSGVYSAVCLNFFPPNPAWPPELIKVSVFFLGLMGAALATQSDRLFNIDMFMRSLSTRGKLVMRVLTGLFTIYICYYLFAAAWPTVMTTTTEMHVEAPTVPAPYHVIILPVSICLIAFHLAIRVIVDVYYLASGKAPPHLAGETVHGMEIPIADPSESAEPKA